MSWEEGRMCANYRGVAVEALDRMPVEQTRDEFFQDLWSFVGTVVQSVDRLFPGRAPGAPFREEAGGSSSVFAELDGLLDLCRCTTEVLDLLAPGILVLDGEGRCLLSNQAARCL